MHEVLGVGRRRGEVDDRGLRVEVDLDQLAGVLGDVATRGDDERDRVADVAHVGRRERRAATCSSSPSIACHAATEPAVEVGGGEHGDDAGQLPGGATCRAG